jgi:hypothetical protein
MLKLWTPIGSWLIHPKCLWLDCLESFKAHTILGLSGWMKERHTYIDSRNQVDVSSWRMCLIGLSISKLNMNKMDFDSHVQVVLPWNIKVSITLATITKWRERRLANCTGFGFLAPTKEGPMLDHIFILLGPASPTPPSLPGLPARTCVGTPSHWEPMW